MDADHATGVTDGRTDTNVRVREEAIDASYKVVVAERWRVDYY